MAGSGLGPPLHPPGPSAQSRRRAVRLPLLLVPPGVARIAAPVVAARPGTADTPVNSRRLPENVRTGSHLLLIVSTDVISTFQVRLILLLILFKSLLV